MMSGDPSYEEQIRKSVAGAEAGIIALEGNAAYLEKRRIVPRNKVQKFETPSQIYTSKKPGETSEPNQLLLPHCLKHIDTVITIVTQNSGTTEKSQATNIIHSMGFVKSHKYANADHIIQTLL